jgi:hemolysin III
MTINNTSARLKALLTPVGFERSERPEMPRWRGRSHQIALGLSIPAGVALIVSAHNITASIAASVYVLTLCGLFTSSSVYNRFIGTPRFRPWMRWTDHAMIYALIAGTYVPTCLLTLPRNVGVPLLILVWSAAAIGMVTKFLLRQRFRIVGGVLYPMIGGAVVLAAPHLLTSELISITMLFALGGALYGIGGISLYLRRPDPNPVLFGYHEVWHLYVIGGATLHFVANWLTVGRVG